MAEFYAQRADAGFTMTECTMVARDASAFIGEGEKIRVSTSEGAYQERA